MNKLSLKEICLRNEFNPFVVIYWSLKYIDIVGIRLPSDPFLAIFLFYQRLVYSVLF